LGKGQGRLVVKVPPLAFHPQLGFRQEVHGLSTAITSTLTTRDASSGCFERAFGFAIPTGREDACAI
jgi:hypothetical protein